MRKAEALHMEWCLDCHRHPETFVREKEEAFKFVGSAANTKLDAAAREKLVEEYGIVTEQLSNCSICHR
jgi:hypothetical protein